MGDIVELRPPGLRRSWNLTQSATPRAAKITIRFSGEILAALYQLMSERGIADMCQIIQEAITTEVLLHERIAQGHEILVRDPKTGSMDKLTFR